MGLEDKMRPKASRVRWPGCVLGILFIAALVVVSGAYLWLYMDHTGPTLVRASHQAEPPAQAPYTLSTEQQQLVDEIGYPDTFTLLFYQDLDEQDQAYDIRFECWHYGAAGRDVVFVNGEKLNDESASAPEGALVAAPFRPEQFSASMGLKDVLASAGISEYVRAAADPGLVASGEVYFASQLTFGMKAGHLMAVETVPLEAEG
jgi:hypothetical protein